MVDVETFKQWHGQTGTRVLHRVHHVEQQTLLVSEELVDGRQRFKFPYHPGQRRPVVVGFRFLHAALAGFVLFLLVFVFWRYVSLASITAAAAMPLLVYLLWAPPHAPPLVVTFGTLFAAALVIYKHKANLQRLLSGSEPRYLAGKSKDGAA